MAHKVIEEILVNNNWRDGEFAKYKANSNKVDESLWCRMCIPMIYAHWEGFVVDSLKILLDHLNRLDLSHAQVKTNLIVVSLGDSYKSLSGKQSFEQRINFTNKYNELLKNTVKFKTKIETKSNLKSNVLKDLCEMFDLCFIKFKDVINDIDRLVNIRNSIAHGENSILPTRENISKYIEAVKNAMDILLGEVDSFLQDEHYLLKFIE